MTPARLCCAQTDQGTSFRPLTDQRAAALQPLSLSSLPWPSPRRSPSPNSISALEHQAAAAAVSTVHRGRWRKARLSHDDDGTTLWCARVFALGGGALSPSPSLLLFLSNFRRQPLRSSSPTPPSGEWPRNVRAPGRRRQAADLPFIARPPRSFLSFLFLLSFLFSLSVSSLRLHATATGRPEKKEINESS